MEITLPKWKLEWLKNSYVSVRIKRSYIETLVLAIVLLLLNKRYFARNCRLALLSARYCRRAIVLRDNDRSPLFHNYILCVNTSAQLYAA